MTKENLLSLGNMITDMNDWLDYIIESDDIRVTRGEVDADRILHYQEIFKAIQMLIVSYNDDEDRELLEVMLSDYAINLGSSCGDDPVLMLLVSAIDSLVGERPEKFYTSPEHIW